MVVQDASNIKASDFNPVLIDHGEVKTITLSFTQLPADGRVCILNYGLQFWNKDTKEWDDYLPAKHGFVRTYSNGPTVTLQASYDSGKWSDFPDYNVTAKLWVRSPETVQTENYVEDTFKIYIKEKCRLVEMNSAMSLTGQTVQSISKS